MTKYNWGIIGTGWIAHDMADALNKTNGEIYAAANPNEAHLTEFVKENTTGFHLKEPMTADSISSDILKTLANPELTAVAKQGQDFVFDHYSWDGVTQRFEEVIHNWFE